MSELEKCLSGEIFNCHDRVFLNFKKKARDLLLEYNQLKYDEKDKKKSMLRELLGSIGENVSVGMPFLCDYGRNIHVGSNVSINMNCSFMDVNKITIGDNVLVAPNVQIYTATHPIEAQERVIENWDKDSGKYFCRTYTKPVSIGSKCWIGGGSIILPGVTIGGGSVIGAGSVVVKDIPENCVAASNPCRVIRKINKGDSHV